MKKALALSAFVALGLGLGAPAAQAACYLVYGPGQELVYRAPEPPVDLSRPLHETLPAVAPGGTLVFSLESHGCERGAPAAAAQRSDRCAGAPRAFGGAGAPQRRLNPRCAGLSGLRQSGHER